MRKHLAEDLEGLKSLRRWGFGQESVEPPKLSRFNFADLRVNSLSRRPL